MWFKNIQVYKIDRKENLNVEKLEESMKEFEFTHCSEYDLFQTGWVQVLKTDSSLVQKVKNCYFISLRTEKKNIPSSVVKEELEKRKAKYSEENDGAKSSKTLNDEFKEAIILNLASKAFCSSSYLHAYIDLDRDMIVVDTGSTKAAEELLGLLRSTIGGLNVTLIEAKDDVSITLSQWISNNSHPKIFEIGMNAELKDVDGGGINVKKHDVEADEIRNHLKNGKHVVKLELIWQKRVQFSITNKFEIKAIKPLDIIKEDIDEELGESTDEYSTFSANNSMMVEDFAEIIHDLLDTM